MCLLAIAPVLAQSPTAAPPKRDAQELAKQLTFIQPFVAYNTKSATTYTVQSESTANWEAASGQKWTIPLNFIVSKVVPGRPSSDQPRGRCRLLPGQAGRRTGLEDPDGRHAALSR